MKSLEKEKELIRLFLHKNQDKFHKDEISESVKSSLYDKLSIKFPSTDNSYEEMLRIYNTELSLSEEEFKPLDRTAIISKLDTCIGFGYQLTTKYNHVFDFITELDTIVNEDEFDRFLQKVVFALFSIKEVHYVVYSLYYS